MSVRPASPEPMSARIRAPGALASPGAASTAATAATASAPAVSEHALPTVERLLVRPGSGRPARSRSRLMVARFLARARADSQLALALAIAIAIAAMEAISAPRLRPVAIVGPLAFVLLQAGLMQMRRAPSWLPLVRLGITLGFVVLADLLIDTTGTWPLNAFLIPVVALGASLGGVGATGIAVLGIAAALLPLVIPGEDPEIRRAALAVTLVAIVVAVGSRRIVLT